MQSNHLVNVAKFRFDAAADSPASHTGFRDPWSVFARLRFRGSDGTTCLTTGHLDERQFLQPPFHPHMVFRWLHAVKGID